MNFKVASLPYNELSAQEKVHYRFNLFAKLFDNGNDIVALANKLGVSTYTNANQYIQLVKELMHNPFMSSLRLQIQLRQRYGLNLTVDQLTTIYMAMQKNEIIQDLLRYNSSQPKVVAIARSLVSSNPAFPVLDLHVTAACMKKCEKCWRVIENESGKKILIYGDKKEGQPTPSEEVIRQLIKDAIDNDVHHITTDGEGDPMMDRRLPDIYEFARNYEKTKQKNNTTHYVFTGGLGILFDDNDALNKLITNIDMLRFSMDSFDSEFLQKYHSISHQQTDEIIKNIQKVASIRDKVNPSMEIEMLVLLQGDNFKHLEEIIQKAKDLGINRILINTLVNRQELQPLREEYSEPVNAIYQAALRGQYYPLQLDFAPSLLESIEAEQLQDEDNAEPSLGKYGPCLRSMYAWIPIFNLNTGNMKYCYQQSFPYRDKRFIIGNINTSSSLDLLEKFRRDAAYSVVQRDCPSDCREVDYPNRVLWKIISDLRIGIPIEAQPFIQANPSSGNTEHSIYSHNGDIEKAIPALKRLSNDLYDVQLKEFEKIAQIFDTVTFFL